MIGAYYFILYVLEWWEDELYWFSRLEDQVIVGKN